jgi:hypothetical protein
MGWSAAKLGFWRCAAIGICLELIHWGLSYYWAELSPHYRGHHNFWATVFLTSEYCLLVLTLTAGVGTITGALSTRKLNQSRVLKIVLCCAAYFAFFVWILR